MNRDIYFRGGQPFLRSSAVTLRMRQAQTALYAAAYSAVAEHQRQQAKLKLKNDQTSTYSWSAGVAHREREPKTQNRFRSRRWRTASDGESPLNNWREPGGQQQDSSSPAPGGETKTV